MSTDQGPGLDNQSGARAAARVAAVVLGLLAVVVGILSFEAFTAGMQDPMAPSGFEAVLLFGAAGFCLVLAYACANVGWLRAQTSYVAGETRPVVKEPLDRLRSGPICRQCGTRNDETAKFCDSCGQSLA